MNHSEYHKKTHPELYRRSWPYSLISLVLAVAIVIGNIFAWRHLAHDWYLISTVIIPSALVGIFLLLAALNGRPQVVKSIFGQLLYLVWFWP